MLFYNLQKEDLIKVVKNYTYIVLYMMFPKPIRKPLEVILGKDSPLGN